MYSTSQRVRGEGQFPQGRGCKSRGCLFWLGSGCTIKKPITVEEIDSWQQILSAGIDTSFFLSGLCQLGQTHPSLGTVLFFYGFCLRNIWQALAA